LTDPHAADYDGGVRIALTIARTAAAALLAGALAGAGCTHTVDGTGAPDTTSSSGTSGTSGASGSSGSNTACASVGSIAGTWQVREPINPQREACDPDFCDISQAACAVTLGCTTGTYTGTIEGTVLRWQGFQRANCTATITPAGRGAEGTCTPVSGPACFFLASKI
jgi:hypothetical protein